MEEQAPVPGDAMVMALPDGAYGACQVTGVADGYVAACALRWYSTTPPSLADLAGAEPLRLDHHAHDGGLAHLGVLADEPLPDGFRWLGWMSLPSNVPALCDRYSGWLALAGRVVAQRRWDERLPAAVKDAYKAASGSDVIVIDFGRRPVRYEVRTSRLDLTIDGLLPAAGPVRWSELDRLPRVTELVWSGPARGLVEALAARPLIAELIWRDAPPVVDLAGTGLIDLTVSGDVVRDVRLPSGLGHLTLVAPHDRMAVQAADRGRWLGLWLADVGAGTVVPAGLDGVRSVRLDGTGTFTATSLGQLRDLRSLHLVWREPPGRLVDAAALAGLDRLRHVELVNAYGIDADTLPDLPALTHVRIDGLRRSVVPELERRYRGTNVRLAIDVQ